MGIGTNFLGNIAGIIHPDGESLVHHLADQLRARPTGGNVNESPTSSASQSLPHPNHVSAASQRTRFALMQQRQFPAPAHSGVPSYPSVPPRSAVPDNYMEMRGEQGAVYRTPVGFGRNETASSCVDAAPTHSRVPSYPSVPPRSSVPDNYMEMRGEQGAVYRTPAGFGRNETAPSYFNSAPTHSGVSPHPPVPPRSSMPDNYMEMRGEQGTVYTPPPGFGKN